MCSSILQGRTDTELAAAGGSNNTNAAGANAHLIGNTPITSHTSIYKPLLPHHVPPFSYPSNHTSSYFPSIHSHSHPLSPHLPPPTPTPLTPPPLTPPFTPPPLPPSYPHPLLPGAAIIEQLVVNGVDNEGLLYPLREWLLDHTQCCNNNNNNNNASSRHHPSSRSQQQQQQEDAFSLTAGGGVGSSGRTRTRARLWSDDCGGLIHTLPPNFSTTHPLNHHHHPLSPPPHPLSPPQAPPVK